MSPAARESKWIEDELDWAEQQLKPIFTVLLDGRPWFGLRTTNYEDVTNQEMPSQRLLDAFTPSVKVAPSDGTKSDTALAGVDQIMGDAQTGDILPDFPSWLHERLEKGEFAVTARYRHGTSLPWKLLVKTRKPLAGERLLGFISLAWLMDGAYVAFTTWGLIIRTHTLEASDTIRLPTKISGSTESALGLL